MKIFVCVKQVPDTETKVRLADAASVDFNGIKWVMNPYDELAVEESIKIRDANPGSLIHVVSLGPKKRTIEVVRTALAMGADEGLLIDAPDVVDPLTTAHGLAAIIKQEGGADLILAGKLAIDDNAASVPQMLAEVLGYAHASVVSKISVSGASVNIERDIEGGSKEHLQLTLPAVVSANKGLNTPRYASLPGIMKAKKKVMKEFDLASLSLPASQISVSKLALPADKPAAKIISGATPNAVVSELVRILKDEAKVL
jgi:electron transfer flavoprotein beta subunit